MGRVYFFYQAHSSCILSLSFLFVARAKADMRMTQKSFNFAKKQGLPFYFVSAADGTNVVKVQLKLIWKCWFVYYYYYYLYNNTFESRGTLQVFFFFFLNNVCVLTHHHISSLTFHRWVYTSNKLDFQPSIKTLTMLYSEADFLNLLKHQYVTLWVRGFRLVDSESTLFLANVFSK